MEGYGPPVDKLLQIGDLRGKRDWTDYIGMGLGPEHISDLTRMAVDDELNSADSGSGRGLGPYPRVEGPRPPSAPEPAIPALVGIVAGQDDDDINDWITEELPTVLGMIGPAAIPDALRHSSDARTRESTPGATRPSRSPRLPSAIRRRATRSSRSSRSAWSGPNGTIRPQWLPRVVPDRPGCQRVRRGHRAAPTPGNSSTTRSAAPGTTSGTNSTWKGSRPPQTERLYKLGPIPDFDDLLEPPPHSQIHTDGSPPKQRHPTSTRIGTRPDRSWRRRRRRGRQASLMRDGLAFTAVRSSSGPANLDINGRATIRRTAVRSTSTRTMRENLG